MKLILIIILLAFSAQGIASALACTMLGWFEVLEVKFHLNTLPAGPYKFTVDGNVVSENCFISGPPCLSQVETESANTLKVVINFALDDQPAKVDIALLKDTSPYEVLLERFDVNLNWEILSYPNGAPECGVQDTAKITLEE